jgi:Dimerisation domain
MANKPPPQAVMLNLTIGHWVARLTYVAAKLKLADLLKDGPRTAGHLAKAAGVHAPALYRVLRALASVGIFAETKGGRFKLTPHDLIRQLI